MFRTDSQLKGVTRRGGNTSNRRLGSGGGGRGGGGSGGGGGGGGGRDGNKESGASALVEQAKREREEREWKRRMFAHATCVQKHWRRYHSFKKAAAMALDDISRKLDDLAKFAEVYGGNAFVPPPAIVHKLLLPFTVYSSGGAPATVGSVLCRLTKLVLLPSLRSLDSTMNFASAPALVAASSKSSGNRSSSSSSSSNSSSSSSSSRDDAVAVSQHSPAIFRVKRLVRACLVTLGTDALSAANVAGKMEQPRKSRAAALLAKKDSELGREESHADDESRVATRPLSGDEQVILLALVQELASATAAVGAVAKEVCVTVTETLRTELIVGGLLRQVLVALPEPKAGSSSGSSSLIMGGAASGIAYRRELLASLEGLWRLTMLCIDHSSSSSANWSGTNSHDSGDSAVGSFAIVPPPSDFVIATFATEILTVPLLYFRSEGRNRGRMGFDNTTEDTKDSSPPEATPPLSLGSVTHLEALVKPSLWFRLVRTLDAAFAQAEETCQDRDVILPPAPPPSSVSGGSYGSGSGSGGGGGGGVASEVWLLGNMISLARLSAQHYPLSPHPSAAALDDSTVQLRVLTKLLETCPLGLLSDSAAVTWTSNADGTSHKPVTLPGALLVQVRSLLDGRSAQRFLDSLCDAHLGGLAVHEAAVLDTVTSTDAAEEKRLLDAVSKGSSGGIESAAQDMAHAESRRKKRTSRWLDSTWAHRALISARKGFSDLLSSSGGGGSGSSGFGGFGGGGGGGDSKHGARRRSSGLLNTSDSARAAAQGDDAATVVSAPKPPVSVSLSKEGVGAPMRAATAQPSTAPARAPLSVPAVHALVHFLAVLLRRWNAGGSGAVAASSSSSSSASSSLSFGIGGGRAVGGAPLVFWMLHTLALSSVVRGRPPLVQWLWTFLQLRENGGQVPCAADAMSSGFSLKRLGSSGPFGSSPQAAALPRGRPLRPFAATAAEATTSRGSSAASEEGDRAAAGLLSILLSQLLVVLDDSEIYDEGKPVSAHQLRRLVKWLRELLFQSLWNTPSWASSISPPPPRPGASQIATAAQLSAVRSEWLKASAEKLLRDLYDRSSRRPFIAAGAWHEAAAEGGRVLAEVQGATPRGVALLSHMPYALPFVERLRLFKQFVDTEKATATQRAHSGEPGVRVRIRRGRVLQDGLRELNGLGGLMKRRLQVEFINDAGASETGVDVGGLFKEFWTDLSALAFNMNFGLFRTTPGEGLLYPNPASEAMQGSDHIELFAFLGRILGKALYEGLTVEPKFAHFFLSYLKGNYNYLNTWHDLATLDAELYKNLMFLKTYDGDAADLCLTFTVADDSFAASFSGAAEGGGASGSDGTNEVELVAGGARLEVTNRNKREYIERVSNYLLVKRIRAQSEAFRRGLHEIINPSWLAMFNEPELQVLISGAPTAIDVEDLKKHCRYQGFTGVDKTVQRFWKIVASLDAQQQAQLLRFVTSCQRPPPLGFEQLNPRFCLQRIGITTDDEKLPSAATCFNTLKLPNYSSEKVMKKKLLLSISSNAGFELT